MRKLTCLGLAIAISIGSFAIVSAKTYNKSSNNKPTQTSNLKVKHGIKVTTKAIKSKGDIVNVDLKIPVINDMDNKTLQNKINTKFEKDILNFKNDFVNMAKKDFESAQKEKYEFRPYEIVVSYEVKQIKNDILSISVTYYEYTGGAHGMADVVTSNIDMKTGKYLKLSDMFKDGNGYKKIINKEIKRQIDVNKENYFSQEQEGFKSISNDQSFYIKNGNVVVYFGLYSIAPYSSGIPEFKIPISQLKQVLKPEFLRLFNK